jgi:hypothetical protein
VSGCLQACLRACCCPVAGRSAPHVCCDAKVPPGGVRFSCLPFSLKERGQPNHPGGVRRCPAACRRVCAPVVVPLAGRSAPHVCCDATVPPGGVRFSCVPFYLKERGQPNHPGGVRRCPAACRRVCAPVAIRWRAGVLRMSAATPKCRPEVSGSVASISL